jgi:uncharacterized protein YdiU (UPF0061 family)
MDAKQTKLKQTDSDKVSTIDELATLANYSLINTLNSDPDATQNGVDYSPRQVFSGHYVPVLPTPIENPEYVTHSHAFFQELGFDDSLATSIDFIQMFSGNTSTLPQPMRQIGWATGYALSIYGTEYIQQCPFQTGNGYGDGRAVSVLEAVIKGKRYEMQLKGGGRTPYCRGADGRAVLRSSIREFLAQEYMHALGVPTSRSLSLYVSKTQKVNRPWYSPGSRSHDPDVLVSEPVAISTRVAPSFIRVGQLELFARRARKQAHPKAMQELEMIVLHAIQREYSDVIDNELSTADKVVLLAREFRSRLCALVANWIRVGFCQGNFNSDNCAVGGYTLDYGPFGFIDVFSPDYQSWTGGGRHFSFLNQPQAAQRNFDMFCSALRPLLATDQKHLAQLDEIQVDFAKVIQGKMEKMWASKLGLSTFHPGLLNELFSLMMQTSVDYTIFFRQLSNMPKDIEPLKKSFYKGLAHPNSSSKAGNTEDLQALDARWSQWLEQYQAILKEDELASSLSRDELSKQMKAVNPKYCLREWFVAPAYQQASLGNYSLVRELQQIMTQPYAEQTKAVEGKYYQLKPFEFFELGGVSHYSCSS